MIQKFFNRWLPVKEHIHQQKQSKFYKEGQVWWCSLGANVGFEEDGKGVGFERPVLVLKGLSRRTCLVAPLTTSTNTDKNRIYVGDIDGKEARVILSQMRVVDTKRFNERVCNLDKNIFLQIRKNAREMF